MQMQIIKHFSDNSFLTFGRGSFDDWCVFLKRPNMARFAPRDSLYFSQLKELAKKHGADKIYKDYVMLYSVTKPEIEQRILDGITRLTSGYGEDSLELDIIFTILYMGMVAEENKKGTKLGKRIKRLGMYELLINDKDVLYAADFMRGKRWWEINQMCRKYGF